MSVLRWKKNEIIWICILTSISKLNFGTEIDNNDDNEIIMKSDY